MESQGYIKIYSGNFIIAQRIREELEKQGISPIIKDDSESARLAGFGTFSQGLQDLFIHQDELEKSRSIVEAIKGEMETNN
ncbi:DUF2007 domain-containing protein [Ichthyenterobacterium sp. W332]|uniref:DUF2007 domain-containing protein n=1 Tax=Microcosmobacter mediterraneus TaxID=3075607 RepID=A0ABU2YHE5_9FLAO|nr:DUF2007 domain-containing protein [Ichthyenterobacterium sp. W332]MDT0557585.1 DUF2007 domain-containing protein [Ichthyenterobacterium sp. W332]